MEFYYDAVDKDVLILSADGGLMLENAGEFESELGRYIELGSRKLIVDCTRLTRISSYGLGALVSLHRRLAKQGGDVKLANVSGVVGKLIEMFSLGTLLQIYPTVDDARRAFAGKDGEIVDADGLDSRHPQLD